MKKEELRIGNWVFNKAHERKQIKEIYTDCSVYDPIPLTEEWLLKFGFELKDKVNMGFIKQINFPHMKNYLYANSKFHTTALWDDKKQVEIFIMNQAKYVHQLQNLYFALTNTELTL